MPIRKYLETDISNEVAQAMIVAFDLACRSARERELSNISTQAVAAKIFALVNSGETDPERIAEMALSGLVNENLLRDLSSAFTQKIASDQSNSGCNPVIPTDVTEQLQFLSFLPEELLPIHLH